MSNARNLSDIIGGNFDIPVGALTNAPNPITSGTIAAFAMSSAPTNWLAADGSAISRTTYSDLFTVIGTTWGTGDGSTTFNIPDLRGAFVRGSGSHGTSNDAGGTAFGGQSVGNYQNDQMQKIVGRVAHGQGNSGAGLIKRTNNTGAFTMSFISQTLLIQSTAYTTNYMNYSDFDSADSTNSRASSSTGGETRPFNAAMLFCIKT